MLDRCERRAHISAQRHGDRCHKQLFCALAPAEPRSALPYMPPEVGAVQDISDRARKYLGYRPAEHERGAAVFRTERHKANEERRDRKDLYRLLAHLRERALPHPAHSRKIPRERRRDRYRGQRYTEQAQRHHRAFIAQNAKPYKPRSEYEQHRRRTAKGNGIYQRAAQRGTRRAAALALTDAERLGDSARSCKIDAGGSQRQGKAPNAGAERVKSHHLRADTVRYPYAEADADRAHHDRRRRHQQRIVYERSCAALFLFRHIRVLVKKDSGIILCRGGCENELYPPNIYMRIRSQSGNAARHSKNHSAEYGRHTCPMSDSGSPL